MLQRRLLLILSISLLVIFSACDDSSTGVEAPEPEIEANTAEDINADGQLAFFNLRTGEVVDRADSASTEWDLAFNSTTIRVNSGVSGPGSAAALVLDVPFNSVEIAPSEGYNTDSEESFAIPSGSGNGWYNYNPSTHIVTPMPDKTIVLRTADGNHYAKVEILSYYKGSPEEPSGEGSRHYSFRYVIQQTEGLRELQ